MLDREAAEKEKRFINWLSDSVGAVEKEKRKNLSLQTSSPPTWVFDLPEIKSWLDIDASDKAKILWLSGTTGFGKSVMAAYITNELIYRFPSSAVAFFFCKDNDFLREPHNVMRTFAYQVTLNSPAARTSLSRAWEQQDEFQNLFDIEVDDLFHTLIVDSLLSISMPNVFFILDGINECSQESQKGTLKFLALLQTCHQLRILVTSQPTPDLVRTLPPSTKLELREFNN